MLDAMRAGVRTSMAGSLATPVIKLPVARYLKIILATHGRTHKIKPYSRHGLAVDLLILRHDDRARVGSLLEAPYISLCTTAEPQGIFGVMNNNRPSEN